MSYKCRRLFDYGKIYLRKLSATGRYIPIDWDIGMNIHRILGKGFLEIVYKDAFECELRTRQIHYEREKEFEIKYKEIILPHKFYADFVIENKLILEIKSKSGIIDEHYAQVLNYLAVSKIQV